MSQMTIAGSGGRGRGGASGLSGDNKIKEAEGKERRKERGRRRGTMVSPQGDQSSDGHYQSSYGRRQTAAYTDDYDDHKRLQV